MKAKTPASKRYTDWRYAGRRWASNHPHPQEDPPHTPHNKKKKKERLFSNYPVPQDLGMFEMISTSGFFSVSVFS